MLSFDEFALLLRRLAPRTSPARCAAIFAEALRASGPGGGVSPRAFARVAASHGLGLARPPPAVGAAAAPHVSELQLLTELWAATALRLEAMQEAQPAALAALEPRLAAFREQLGSAEPGALDGLSAAYREITSEIARLEAVAAAEGEGALGEGAVGEAAEAGERAGAAVPSVDE